MKHGHVEAEREYERLFRVLWEKGGSPYYDTGLWTVGTREFPIKDHYNNMQPVECLGIRLDPTGIDLILADAGVAPTVDNARTPLIAAIPQILEAPVRDASPSKGNLPIGEYDRLGRAIAAGWGTTISEDTAWARAKAIFPHHNVRKREFLASFRRERGHKKPGKQPSHQKD
jgi:hypothetical protein